MRWMTRRRAGGDRDRDRGAAAIIVAVVVSAFMLGLGALVTDVGSWYSERAQVQNGADAGALAVAQTCAAGNCVPGAAANYAPANNNGTLNTSSAVIAGFPCGNAPGSVTALPSCPAGSENGTYCPLPPPSGTPYVDVRLNTSNVVAPILGTFLDKTDTGKTIRACAQARWGAPLTLGSAVALTISACEWLDNTNNGTTFAKTSPTPPSFLDTLAARKAAGINYTNAADPNKESSPDDPPGAPVAGSETVLATHNLANTCAAGHPGWDAPGKFGWLAKKNSPCTVTITNNEYPGSPGNAPADCNTIFNNSRNTKTPVFLPVYTRIDPATGNYVLDGFAAFVITGWDIQQGSVFSPVKADSVISTADGVTPTKDRSYCGSTYTGSNSDVCIYGYFTQALIKQSDFPGGSGGNNLGATAPFLTG